MRALNYAALFIASSISILAQAREQQVPNYNVNASLEELKAQDTPDIEANQDTDETKTLHTNRAMLSNFPRAHRMMAHQQQLQQKQDVWPDESTMRQQDAPMANQANPNLTAPMAQPVNAVAAVDNIVPTTTTVVAPNAAPIAPNVAAPIAPNVVPPVFPNPFNYSGALYNVDAYRFTGCGCPALCPFVPPNPCYAYCTDVRCYDLRLFGLNPYFYRWIYEGHPYYRGIR